VPGDDPARVDTLLGEQAELRGPDRPARGVRADGESGLPVGAGAGRKERSSAAGM
jgi:hypothetical protein